MAHEIETYQDKAAAVFARVDAWHRLGTTVAGEAFTAEDALRLGHLGGWDVRKVALTATELSEDGVHSIAVPDHFATVRTSPFTGHPEALGVVGRGYTPLQNEEHCEFLNRLADESGAIFDTAGSLRGGRQVFVTMRLPETMRVGGVDDVTVNIAALNSHDGSMAFRLLVTPVRVVCANTQAAALRDARVVYSSRRPPHPAREPAASTGHLAQTVLEEADVPAGSDVVDNDVAAAVQAGMDDFDRQLRETKAAAVEIDLS